MVIFNFFFFKFAEGPADSKRSANGAILRLVRWRNDRFSLVTSQQAVRQAAALVQPAAGDESDDVIGNGGGDRRLLAAAQPTSQSEDEQPDDQPRHKARFVKISTLYKLV